jgi:hypothetical protein
MNHLDPNTGGLPPALRALAMGLVGETAMPMLNQSPHTAHALAGDGARGADSGSALWQDLRWKCDEILALVFQADDPEKAAAYVLSYLPRHVEHVFEYLCGRKHGRT